MIFVMIGGFFGAMSRFYIGKLLAKKSRRFPFSTLSVNILGSFLLGIAVNSTLPEALYQLIGIGFLGAFTTFSTFSYEALQLLLARRFLAAGIYISSSVMLGFAAFIAAFL
jgi:fluoride exporter